MNVWETTIIPYNRISEATEKGAELRKLISSGLRSCKVDEQTKATTTGDILKL